MQDPSVYRPAQAKLEVSFFLPASSRTGYEYVSNKCSDEFAHMHEFRFSSMQKVPKVYILAHIYNVRGFRLLLQVSNESKISLYSCMCIYLVAICPFLRADPLQMYLYPYLVYWSGSIQFIYQLPLRLTALLHVV